MEVDDDAAIDCKTASPKAEAPGSLLRRHVSRIPKYSVQTEPQKEINLPISNHQRNPKRPHKALYHPQRALIIIFPDRPFNNPLSYPLNLILIISILKLLQFLVQILDMLLARHDRNIQSRCLGEIPLDIGAKELDELV